MPGIVPKKHYLYGDVKFREMNLLNFVAQYPDEATCRAAFKAYRD